MTDIALGEYRLQQVYGQATPELGQEIVDFWRRNHALPAGDDGQLRCRQVFYIARDAGQQIAGICSVYISDFRTPGDPHYFYRTFIQPSHRHSRLAVHMWIRTTESLQAEYAPGKPKGIVIVAENPRLSRPLAQRRLRAAGYQMVGHDARGCAVFLKRLAPLD